MEGAMKLAFAAVAASIGLGLPDPSFACSLSPDAIAKRPRLEEVVTSRPIVFIGTVVDVLPGEKLFIGDPPRDVSPPLERDPFAKAKFKIEIPIRGVTGDFIEIRSGQVAMCGQHHQIGERWFFAGDANGSNFLDRSALLVDHLGNSFVAVNADLVRLFPKILELPPPPRP
jgi:hypothetical protein